MDLFLGKLLELRWIKASSEYIVRDTEVCKGIVKICGRFVTIYGERLPCEGFLALIAML